MGSFTQRVQGADSRNSSFDAGASPHASLVISSVPCRFFTAVMYNSSGADVFFQVHDAASLPANGAVPILVQKITSGNTGSFDYTDGIPFKNGVVLANSSTNITLTIGAADGLFVGTVRKP